MEGHERTAHSRLSKGSRGIYCIVEELPGANSQGETLDEARVNLREAIQLVLEANRTLAKESLGDKTVIRELIAKVQ